MASLILAVFACGERTDGPEEVTQKFLTHFYKREFKEAKKFVSPTNLKQIEGLEKTAKPRIDTAGVPVIENLECVTQDDSAVCTCTVNGIEEKIDLIRVEGKWLIDNPKEHQQRKFEQKNNSGNGIIVVDEENDETQHDH